jgi:uncharacterized membrane protein
MEAESRILLWWVLFGGTHILGSSAPVRARLVRVLGLRGFKGLYSLVALATFIPLCYVFFTNKHAGAILFTPSPLLSWLAQGLMLLSIVVLVQGLLSPSPLTTQAEMKSDYPDRARGIHRITRHPQNLAFALFGLAHCLSNPSVGDWVFFGGFSVYAVISAAHQDRRTLATGPDAVRRFQAETSFIPFGAIASGRQHLAPGEYSIAALVVSVALFFVLRFFHARLFGGFGG